MKQEFEQWVENKTEHKYPVSVEKELVEFWIKAFIEEVE